MGCPKLSYYKENTTPFLGVWKKHAATKNRVSYYPFGSTQDGLSYIDNTLKNNDLKNKYLFGGQEQDSKTGFFEYHYRQYDSWLGRWHVVDPMAEMYGTQSPYHFAGDNPINNMETNGATYYMIPGLWNEDDDGFSFDIGDGLGSDGGGGWDLFYGADRDTDSGSAKGSRSRRASTEHTPYIYPNRNPLNEYTTPVVNEGTGNGWMPRDQAGGGCGIVVTNTTTKEVNGITKFSEENYYYLEDANGNWGFVDEEGNGYQGGNPYIDPINDALNMLMSKPTGRNLVTNIASNQNNLLKIVISSITETSPDAKIISWNSTKEYGVPSVDGSNERPPFIALGHELAHVLDKWNNTFNMGEWFKNSSPDGKTKPVPLAEISATHVENEIRAEHNISLRSHYVLDKYGNPFGPAIIRRGTRQSMYYNKNGITNYKPIRRKDIKSGIIPFTY
jgi:RHS repeat-associated protein